MIQPKRRPTKSPASPPTMGRKPSEPQLDSFAGRFAARIRELREKRGKDPEQIAEMLGVAVTTYRGWENGSRVPSIAIFPELAESLGVSVRSLLPEK